MPNASSTKWLFCENRAEAIAVQKEMSSSVIIEDVLPPQIKSIGGMDVSNTRFDPKQMLYSALVICAYPCLSLVQTVTAAKKQTFPYISGLLGFREAPPLISTFQQLSQAPDLIMVDGHGISHPRRLGIASHLGVLLDIPTIGVAKSILVGKPAAELGEEAGSMVPLIWKGEEIAMMVRTKKRCNPLIISAGHKISLETATYLVMQCLKKHRLPEPTRHAHFAANSCRKNFSSKDSV